MLRGIGTRRDCQILNVDFIGPKVRSGPVADALITAQQNNRFGSLADLFTNISLMSAFLESGRFN
jgi:hypothetical protein